MKDVKTLDKLLLDLDEAYELLNNVMEIFPEDRCHDLCEDLLLVEDWTQHGQLGFPLETRKARISIAKFNSAKDTRKLDLRSDAISEVSRVIKSFKLKVH